MKTTKRRMLKNVSLVALSAVMVSGVALTAAGCGGGGKLSPDDTITVNIFCSESDKHTNQTICDKWKAMYSQKMGIDIKVDLTTTTLKDNYFTTLNNTLNGGLDKIADVIYLSPKYVQRYAKPRQGKPVVMDLTDYLVTDADAVQNIGEIWSSAISYYGYNKDNANYTLGQDVVYNANGAQGAGFYTASGAEKVGIYGLPKDYSNFSMGYNKKFFSNDLKKAYETTKGSTPRNVENVSSIASSGSYAKKYEGYKDANDYVATFAASGEYKLSDGTTKTATEGQEAPLIAIGVPVTYKPFNFYRYATFTQALNAGDPIACATDEFSPNHEGYTVTLPGFPGDTFEITDQTNAKATNVPYDASIGHNVFTYAEYGALVWAVTYYLNTFDWDSNDPTSGKGGIANANKQEPIYGSEQYEGAQGNALYLLPWLASNDADLIDSSAKKCSNDTAGKDKNENAYAQGGTTAETRSKKNLDGTDRNAQVQYGMNSKNFMETYGAYQEFGSTWNGNSGHAGDVADAQSKTSSGWDYFRAGQAVFYGAGTWDASARNDTKMDVFEFGQMPAPVSEKLALYTATKDANYDSIIYSNDDKAKGTGDAANGDYDQRSDKAAGKKVYTKTEIVNNQIKRQDKWAARMDSVGYAANGRLAELKEGDPEYWKKEGAASLIAALTIGREEQVTLTYAGAQLPNFKDQCSDFLNYQTATDGAFKDMITPDGFADTTDKTQGRAIWDHYYNIALAMAADSIPTSSKNGQTVEQWFASNPQFTDYGGSGAVRYDTQYKDVVLKNFTGENGTNISFAMKVLRMVCFTYAERDLNIRMQYGLNSARDASMYTEDESWINSLDGSTSPKMLAYRNKQELTTDQKMNFKSSAVLARKESENVTASFYTPAVFCMLRVTAAQNSLK
ncbi:MAG: hypothetical protein K2N84_06850 [Clostridia bacterium]|nr:hypothetical protein [Clostridia bacterium]